MGPDEDILFDENTTSMGQPVGAGFFPEDLVCGLTPKSAPARAPGARWPCAPILRKSVIAKRTSDQWKIGGGSVWGWWPADFDENLMYYGQRQPRHLEPGRTSRRQQVVHDHFCPVTSTTGVARWVYQMTPHDEWGL